MKKVLLVSAIAGVMCFGQTVLAVSPYGYLGPQNEGNRNFSTLKQHQFEKEETLDFINNSEDYKEKREKKEKFLDYQQGKVDVPPSVQTQYNLQGSRPGTNNMQFIKDENGKIRIKSY